MTFGPSVGSSDSVLRLLLYEQCSLHSVLKMWSSVNVGFRPRSRQTSRSSWGVRLTWCDRAMARSSPSSLPARSSVRTVTCRETGEDLLISGACLVDDELRQRRRRWLLVPTGGFEIVAKRLFVEAWHRAARSPRLRGPEA